MKKQKKEVEVRILNGTRVWFGVIGFLIIHGGTGIWWASSLSTKVDTIDKKVTSIVTTIEENRKEAKQDNKDLRDEVSRKMIVRK